MLEMPLPPAAADSAVGAAAAAPAGPSLVADGPASSGQPAAASTSAKAPDSPIANGHAGKSALPAKRKALPTDAAAAASHAKKAKADDKSPSTTAKLGRLPARRDSAESNGSRPAASKASGGSSSKKRSKTARQANDTDFDIEDGQYLVESIRAHRVGRNGRVS